MAQIFQVLKCYKCSVFQVHQTKKSSKWECKLCGEKQSVKRHYGLGTGKECRLHVQKLNGIRGEVDDLHGSIELSKDSDEEPKLKYGDCSYRNTQILEKAHTKNESKWSNFIDKTELEQEPEVNETMYLGNTEVVLEIPTKKRRKFNTPKVIHKSTAYIQVNESSAPKEIECLQNEIDFLNSDLSVTFCKVNSSKLSITPLSKYKVSAKETNCITPIRETDKLNVNEKEANKTIIHETQTEVYVPPKIIKNSKWAQFAEEPAECLKPLSHSQENSDIPNNLFSLCDEKELDDVLNF